MIHIFRLQSGARKARSLVQVQGGEQGGERNWLCSVVTDCVSALSECLITAFHSSKECGLWAAGSWPMGHTAVLKPVLQDCNLHGLWVPNGQRRLLLSVTPTLGEKLWYSTNSVWSRLWDWTVSPRIDGSKRTQKSHCSSVKPLWACIHSEHPPFGSVNKMHLHS